MAKSTWFLSLTLSLSAASSAFTRSAPAPAEEAPAGVLGLRTVDVDGGIHQLGMAQGLQPVALVFLDTGCPISNRYAPRLNELAKIAATEGVEFYGILSDPTTTAGAARKHRAEYALSFPVIFDAVGDLAERLSPTHVPEAFVLDSDDRVLYRGRIDDRFADLGTLRQTFSSHDLLDAIRASTGENPEKRKRTEPVGCVFEAWDTDRIEERVSYAHDVAPILNANCVECHRDGDIAPFALDTYDQARRRAGMIATVTKKRTMPPWHAVEGAGHFRDERTLSARQIRALEAWAAAGAPEGDAENGLPAAQVSDVRWRLGEPDLLVEMPTDFEVPASGDDIYRYFVIPSELVEEKMIVGMDFRPGDPSVVHHCIAYIDSSGTAARIDAMSEEPGFSVFGEYADVEGQDFDPSGFDPRIRQIAGWAPGTQPYEYPEGMGSPLQAGGDFVLEIHYHLNGKPTTDRSALALYFADGPVEREAVGLVIGTENIDIDPDEPEYWRHVWMDVPTDVDVVEVAPHMHYLGKSVEAVATLPDGSEKSLIRIDDWDFRWQGAYFYRKPVHLPRGSRIDAYFRFDNSSENPFNPSSPPIRVKEGWRTTDEMCLFYFSVAPSKADDRAGVDGLYRAMFGSFMRSGEPE